MKRFLMLTVIVAFIFAVFPLNVFATSVSACNEIIYFEDGSYITVELQVIETRAAATKSASKTYTCRDGDGVEEWRAVLSGTFTYNGTSATCTASSCNVTITDTDWYVVSKTATKSGASALAELTMGMKFIGITVNKKTVNMSLTCDKDGNLT